MIIEHWYEIDPHEAKQLYPNGAIGERDDLPVNELGEQCPWPWDPIQLRDAPLGQYHCPYCGAMVLAGVNHLDYKETNES